jgi:hypothetical protein
MITIWSQPRQTVLWDPISKKKKKKKKKSQKKGWWSDSRFRTWVQVKLQLQLETIAWGPEFKPQYHHEKKIELETINKVNNELKNKTPF